MRVGTEFKIYLGLCLALVLLVGLGGISYRSIAALRETSDPDDRAVRANLALSIIVAVNVAAVLILGVVASFIHRDLMAQRRAHQALERAYRDLGLEHGTRGSALDQAIEQLRGELLRRVEAEQAVQDSHHSLEQTLVELQTRKDEGQAMMQQLWQTAKLATVGELAAGIAHELNNPLAIVGLRIEGLLAQTPADDPKRRLLDIIEQEVERMGILVSNLLQFSRRGRDSVSSMNVHAELNQAVELIQHQLRQRKIEVARAFSADVPLVLADRQKIRQVFLNLFTNAADAMTHGGTLSVRTGRTLLDDGRPAVIIEVTDTGVGISAEHLRRVMEPFFTTKEDGKGTGLGLAICRRIVHEHGGVIELNSALGKGTNVRVTLPVASDKKQDVT